MKTIVVGLGCPKCGNHGAGWKVVDEVKKHLPPTEKRVEVECLSLGGLGLMEHLIGYDKAILIDAIKSDEVCGSVLVMHLEDLPRYSAFHTNEINEMSLQDALEYGRNLGAPLPKRIMVVGITAEKIVTFGNELSPEVRAAVPLAAQAALELIQTSI